VREGYDALTPPILTTCYDADGKPIDGDGATGPLDVTLDATYDFLDTLYDELQNIFPDKFVHVGGDEVPSQCWASNPGVQKYMKANNLTSFADLETLFEQRLLDMLKKKGISYIVWQEIFDNGAKIAPDTVIDVWKGGNWQDEMAAVTKAGFHSVLSAPFYLNYISYGEDWPKYYSIEPSNFTGGEAADKAGLVGGVEVCMWSEFVDAANFISREWPRAASVGERGWSSKEVTDVDDARTRLHELRCKMIARGINAEPITNGGNRDELENHNFCPQEWVPHYSPPWN
jgi:hexosaminidase